MKASLILPVLAFAVRVLAVPPACLLAAVNTQDEPSDLDAICGDDAQDVQEAIVSLCGDNQSLAQSAFISTCSAAGSSVAPYTATHTSESTATASGTFIYTTAVYNSDCDCTTTIVTSATSGAAVSTGLATATSGGASATNTAGSSSATDNAAADAKQVGSFAAAAIAIAGVVAVL